MCLLFANWFFSRPSVDCAVINSLNRFFQGPRQGHDDDGDDEDEEGDDTGDDHITYTIPTANLHVY